MEVGRRVGLDIAGIGLPGHFIVGARVGGELVLLDPFNGGAVLDAGEGGRRSRRARWDGRSKLERGALRAVRRRQIVVRMLRNLKRIYARREDWAKALGVIDRLLVVDADTPMHVRDRGTVLVKLGQSAGARRSGSATSRGIRRPGRRGVQGRAAAGASEAGHSQLVP